MKKKTDRVSTPGFSLVEMLLVIALMGILTALMAPAVFNSLANVRLKTAAKKTVAVTRYVRNQAISHKKPFWLLIDKEKNQLTVMDRPLKDPDHFPEKTVSPPPFLKVYAYPEDVVIGKLMVGKKEIDEPQGAFTFYPNGSCDGGELILHVNNSRFYRITIDFITGTAKIDSDKKTE